MGTMRRCKNCEHWKELKDDMGKCTNFAMLRELRIDLVSPPILSTHKESLCPHHEWRSQ